MNTAADWLSSAILRFIAVLNRCLSDTTFVEDRRLYTDDLVAANVWLNRLRDGESAAVIAATILEPSTAKQFTDYWRQGVWGDMESEALSALQEKIRRQLNS